MSLKENYNSYKDNYRRYPLAIVRGYFLVFHKFLDEYCVLMHEANVAAGLGGGVS